VKTRKGSRNDLPSDDGDFESWISDLTDGETTARQLRVRLDAAGERTDHDCAVCTADESYFGPGGHLHGRRLSA
jgi:hypothetical protein